MNTDLKVLVYKCWYQGQPQGPRVSRNKRAKCA